MAGESYTNTSVHAAVREFCGFAEEAINTGFREAQDAASHTDFITALQRIRWGHDAAALLTSIEGERIERGSYLYRLPLFLPGSNVRIAWDSLLLGVIAPGERLTFRWEAWDQRYGSLCGEVAVEAAPNLQLEFPGFGTVAATRTRADGTVQAVHAANRDGSAAMWELMEMWKTPLKITLATLSSSVYREIRGISTEEHEAGASGGVIDRLEIEQLVDEILLGREGDSSAFIRIAQRAAGDLRAGSGDPWAWMRLNLYSASESAVRRMIGDPAAGRKLRRLFRSEGQQFSTLDELIAAYRELYPSDSLGQKRAMNALTAGPTTGRMSVQGEDILGLLAAPACA